MIRAVLDTNIIVSGLLWGGLPGQIFRAAQAELFVAILTEPLLAETMTVLSREKFAQQIAARQLDLQIILQLYRTAAVMVEAGDVPAGVVRDPKDAIVLACALGGKADFIVSGDKDLLTLAVYQDIPIRTAEQFLRHLMGT